MRFYHDTAAQMSNLRQDAGTATELWSGDLGRVRTVGDGAEQVRLRPRKDGAGTYDAGSETVAAYRYDAYGAQSAAASAAYDIHANPVQYAGEYRDALWGGSYLRARWYAPELPLFLSRDPVAHLGRYGYAGGNPVMRVDPSGRSWKSLENSFAHGRMGWQRWLQHFGGSNAWYSHVARLTAGMLLGPLQMVADPAAFAHAVLHDTGGMDIFLAAGVVSEGAAGYFGLRLTTIAVTQTVGGAGQSAVAAFDRSFGHFNAGTFVTGLEYTAGAELDTFLPRLARSGQGRLADWRASRRLPAFDIASSNPYFRNLGSDISARDDGVIARLKSMFGQRESTAPTFKHLSTMNTESLMEPTSEFDDPLQPKKIKMGRAASPLPPVGGYTPLYSGGFGSEPDQIVYLDSGMPDLDLNARDSGQDSGVDSVHSYFSWKDRQRQDGPR